MTQTPATEDFLLKWRGDTLVVTLTLDAPRRGRAAFRTNIGHGSVRRDEIIAETERGETPLARAWCDVPMEEVKGEGARVFRVEIPLEEVGIYSGKACFFPEGSHVPEWPEGRNMHVKVMPSSTRKANSIYTVFPRQFGSFREIIRKLPTIMDTMGFRIVQTLPPFPVPTTYAVMGEYGCPFAATDFLSVDPAMAEFDEYSTPLDQFLELVDAVHAREGLFLIDLPANHTGWASTLQTHHPEWFHRERDGHFVSPGAWGVKWADLVELDYANAELRAYMADVFLFWCRKGVDGFRCDAGYKIPLKTWEYIVARVREEFPDTIFMLEGLGGELSVTDALLAEANLDWAYSEIFQTYNRDQFEWYLPGAIARAEKYGTLVHFAETHDNDRLAKGGETYARLRVALAALLSWQGAWGIANGVEWYCTEKIDVHGKNNLNWGAQHNMVSLIARLNRLLATHPAFAGASHLRVVTRGGGNTLAVVRDGLLVLANLDCENATEIDWDRVAFPANEARDLVSERRVALAGALRLAPGEVLCLEAAGAGEQERQQAYNSKNGQQAYDSKIGGAYDSKMGDSKEGPRFVDRPSLVHWLYPRDVKRVVVVPEGQWLEIRSPYHFRAKVVDPVRGKTLRAYPSRASRDGFAVRFDAPHYRGDGLGGRVLDLHLVVYAPDKPHRTVSKIVIPPSPDVARVRLVADGALVRAHPEYRTILSNGAGAASQLRVGWGYIASQYDAILAANPNKNVPSDRLNLWTRTRCWLQREGYLREFDAKCVTGFTSDPEGRGARWDFTVPCGMGRTASFAFEITLAEGANAARLKVTRYAGADARDNALAPQEWRDSAAGGDTLAPQDSGRGDVGDRVRIVFRPDIEWRSCHAKTKAYSGLERLFPARCQAKENGFVFRPYEGAFEMTVANGVYHHENEWKYAVAHPDEQQRGQDGSGDLFSPGWISADLGVGDSVEIVGAYKRVGEGEEDSKRTTASFGDSKRTTASAGGDTPAPQEYRWGIEQFSAVRTLSVEEAMRRALDLYIVKRDDLKTVIAGYPWFLDWGRDTFIFLRGMIAAGRIADAVKIIAAFAAFEENGTLPNIICGDTAGNRDTTDAQLWFIRCVQEVAERFEKFERVERFEKDEWCARAKGIVAVCESIVDNYIKGTPNGIRVDAESGLVWSPSHFTWMDTNYPACTPRMGYPVEIQALWISALKFLGRDALAAQAKASVEKYFKWEHGYRDCLAAPNGERAANATPEDTIRPNQLFLITLGVLEDREILRATEELLVPGGMRSLNAGHPLYKSVYAGDEDTSRKPAYHNGTAWGWVFPMYAEALAMTKTCSREVALAFLASALDNVNVGCFCHASEIADGDAPHAQKGCWAQAWSDSELLRVWLKLRGR